MGKALGNTVVSGQREKEIFRRYEWIKFYSRIPPSSTADLIPVVPSLDQHLVGSVEEEMHILAIGGLA